MKKTWAALIDNMKKEKHEKAKVRRLFEVIRKFILYHTWRKYARQVSFERQLMDKNKIEGAYLLLKRFKNRLKVMDDVVARINVEKANHADFHVLKQSLKKERAESVFDDMKTLFDATVKQFDEKVAYERQHVAQTFDRIVKKQES